jgi:PAS domain S-box-containing protein
MTQQPIDLDLLPELLVAQAPDAVIFADRDGVIRVWNAAATRIFGHEQAHAVGQNLDLIVPERFREAHWAGYERAMAAGETKYVGQSLPTRAERDGNQITVELSFAIVLDEDGEAIGALATARDISERWDSDRETRRRLRELEGELAELRGEAALES